jgi:hypothetical protein
MLEKGNEYLYIICRFIISAGNLNDVLWLLMIKCYHFICEKLYEKNNIMYYVPVNCENIFFMIFTYFAIRYKGAPLLQPEL